MDFKFERRRIDKIPRDVLLKELDSVALKLNYVEFGKRDFPKHGSISAGPVVKEFGSWTAAISALRKHLQERGIELRKRSRGYTDAAMFSEIERIWIKLGHRPSRIEWEAANPQISYSGIKRHFKGWGAACLKFIEFKMGAPIGEPDIEPSSDVSPDTRTHSSSTRQKAEDNRNVPLALQLKVLQRDNFRCIYCGRSPATHPRVTLHIDHRTAFATGGRTILENLQTLCADCNLGKGKQVVRHTLA